MYRKSTGTLLLPSLLLELGRHTFAWKYQHAIRAQLAKPPAGPDLPAIAHDNVEYTYY